MANKRMFSKQITTSDAFVDMPVSSQLLYFHLNMEADDDGFVANPKRITRMIGAGDDDLKILLSKRFLLGVGNGIVVIKHWLLHNTVRKDMYIPTQYTEQKKLIQTKDNLVYTEQRNEPVTEPLHRLDKIRLDKNNIEDETSSSKEVPLIIKAFEAINPAVKNYYGNKTQRKACEDLIKSYGGERIITIIENTLPKSNTLPYFPSIVTPVQLRDKFAALENAINKYKSKETMDQKKTGSMYW